MPREIDPAQRGRQSGLRRELAEDKVRDVQPPTIEVICCATCGARKHRAAEGSILPLPCACSAGTPSVTALYRLVAVADA